MNTDNTNPLDDLNNYGTLREKDRPCAREYLGGSTLTGWPPTFYGTCPSCGYCPHCGRRAGWTPYVTWNTSY